MLKTVVQERSGVASGTAEAVLVRVQVAVSTDWSAADRRRPGVRAAGGHPNGPSAEIQLRAYGKEGLLNRKPTATVAEQIWAAVSR